MFSIERFLDRLLPYVNQLMSLQRF